MERSNRLSRYFAIALLSLAALATLAQTLAICLYFDPEVGYCDPNIFSTLLYIILALTLALSLTFACLAHRQAKPPCTFSHAKGHAAWADRLLECLTALAFALAAIWEIKRGGANPSALLRAALALFSALGFVLPAGRARAWLGLFPLAWSVLALAQEYFDWTVALNSPLKLGNQLALLSLLIFMLAELHRLDGKCRLIRHRLSCIAALMLSVPHGVSLIVAASIKTIDRLDLIVHALPPMALGLLAAAHLFTLQVVQQEDSASLEALLEGETTELQDADAELSNIESQAPPSPADQTDTTEEDTTHG